MARIKRSSKPSAASNLKKGSKITFTTLTAASSASFFKTRAAKAAPLKAVAAPVEAADEEDDEADPNYVNSSSSENEEDKPANSDDEDIESSDIGINNVDDKADEYGVEFDSEVEETRLYTRQQIAKTGEKRGTKSSGRLALVSFIDDVVVR